ncbi:MAG: V-type ATP synthase subunit I [Eubacteriaceae bacterium]|nr:V-type ATP synthase subunit I [Eubacteriaceae bacterium]
MAIVKMNKFTLFTFESRKDYLLTELQKFQEVQFIDLKDKTAEEEFKFLKSDGNEKDLALIEDSFSKVKYSIDYIGKYMEKEKGMKAMLKGKESLSYNQLGQEAQKIDWKKTYSELKKHDEEMVSYNNQATKLQSEIEALIPWEKLDVAFSELKQLSTCKWYLGSVSHKIKDEFLKTFNDNLAYSYVEVISEVKEDVNLLVVFHKSLEETAEEVLKENNFTKIHFNYDGKPKDIIAESKVTIENLKAQSAEVKEKIKALGSELENLKLMRDHFATESGKLTSLEKFIKTEKVVAIQGWITVEKNDDLEKILNKTVPNEYFLEFAEPGEDDNVPVLLKNNGFAEAFEPVTAMYSLPNYNEADPTPVFAPFMLVFFGMMLSDAAYGIILTVAAFWALKNIPMEDKRFIKLFFYLGISTTFFGVLYGSYFGDVLVKVVKPIWLDPSSNPMAVLIVAVIMGVIHIFVGLGVKAYNLIKSGKPVDAIYDVLTWYVTIIGAFLMLLGYNPVGKYMAIIGAVSLVATQGRDAKTIGGKLAGGLFGLYGITGYLGDILSYSRLLALGLATGLIGSSFNLMVKLVGTGPITYIFAALIFVGGHTFNILINILGAYVHAARLQYLEFFGKFYDGGGKAFTPFKSDNKYFSITNKEEI